MSHLHRSTTAEPVPSSTAVSPRQLNTEELERYKRDGYLIVEDVFAAAELTLLDSELDRLLEVDGVAAGPNRRGWIYDVRSRSKITQRFAEDPRLLALIQDLVYPGIAVHSSKLVTKLPHSADICHWHQDEAFYRTPDDPDTHSAARMSVWVPLQDANRQNGCLWVVPGSHGWGIDDYTIQDDGTCSRRIDRHTQADQWGIAVPVRAGSVVLFDAYTWHHSKNNTTGHIRRAFIVSYQEATLPKGHDDQWQILVPAGNIGDGQGQ